MILATIIACFDSHPRVIVVIVKTAIFLKISIIVVTWSGFSGK
jgi:hypothetical protein